MISKMRHYQGIFTFLITRCLDLRCYDPFFIMGKLHGKSRPALGQGTQGGGIAEQFHQRHTASDDLGIVFHFHRFQTPPHIADIADNIAGELFR